MRTTHKNPNKTFTPIPVVSLEKLETVDHENTITYWYAIDKQENKEKAIKLIQSKVNEDGLFHLLYDYRINFKKKGIEYFVFENVNVFENRDRNNGVALVLGAKGHYECILRIIQVKEGVSNE